MNIEHRQLVSLNIEIKTATKLIRLGLAELQQISFVNYDIYLACLLLASGYERLMKSIMCLKYLQNYNEFPSIDFIKKYGHNLISQKEYVINKCISKTKALKTPHTKKDYKFLSSDEELENIIRILSDFAQKGRYYNLDIVVRNYHIPPNFQHEWNMKVEKHYQDKLGLILNDEISEKDDLVFKKIYSEIIICLEKFTRALMRIFVFGDLGKEALTSSVYFLHFLKLQDENLGKTAYSDLKMIIGT